MKSKPITSKSKGSPLHVGPGEDGKTPPTVGAVEVYTADGYKLKADDAATSGTPGQPAQTRTKLYSDLAPEDREAARKYNMEKYGTHNPTKEGKANNTIVTKPAVAGTDGERTTKYEPVLTEARDADKVDTFLPWERRWAQRTQRAAVRDEIKRGKKGMRQLDKALKAGAITQEQYDKDYAEAQKLAFGQGTIAKGQYTNTAAMDAIVSQGYQANPAVSSKTDMLRQPKAAQEAGQRVKADGTEAMSQEEYENFGKSTPKTSAAVQDASKKAGASIKIDEAKVASDEASEGKELDIQDIPKASSDLPKVVDANEQTVSVPSKSYRGDGSTKPLGGNDIIKVDAPKPKSSDMFGGLSSTDLTILSEALTDQANDKTNAANEFLAEGVMANTGTGNRSDMMSFEPTARDKAQKEVDAQEEAAKAVESELERTSPMSKRGYKMNRTHSPAMMYNKNAPTRKMGSPLNKLTDLSGDGKVTRKDVLIGRGVLDKDGSPLNKFANDAQRKAVWASKNEKKASAAKYKPTAFKMKGFGSKNNK